MQPHHTTRKPYRKTPVVERFWKYVTPGPLTECWLWHGPTDGDEGYGRLYLVGNKYIYAHRLAYQIHHGSIPDGLDILHDCDTRLCCNPHHLYAGTHAENMEDMKSRKRYVLPGFKGEEYSHAKLTTANVIEIRAMHQSGIPRKDIAQQFGINPGTVTKIVSRQRWAHVP